MKIRNPKDGKWLVDTPRNRYIIRSGKRSPQQLDTQRHDTQVPYAPPAPHQLLVVYILIFIGAIWVGMTELAPILMDYSEYPVPYKHIAMFYNYAIVVPFQSVFNLWIWLLNSMASITSYPTFNIIIGSAGAIIYALILFFIYNVIIEMVAIMFKPLNKGRPSRGGAWILFLMPAIIALIWYWTQSVIV